MSFESMKKRLAYNGGYDQIARINRNKLKSLRRALQADQHSRRIKTPEAECWYGLVNDNKLTADYDRKILAIESDARLSAGDTIELTDDGSHWLIYLPFLSETAYFRTEIIRCRYTVDIDGKTYWIYFQGPTETSTSWFIKDAVNAVSMNLKGTIYIKKDDVTEAFFDRFKNVRIGGKVWEVQATDKFSVPGIIEAVVKETFNDSIGEIADVLDACVADPIMGQAVVEQDGEYGYEARGGILDKDSEWVIDGNDRVRIEKVSPDGRFCTVRVHDGALDGFKVKYGCGSSWYSKKVAIKCCCTPIVGESTVSPYDVLEYHLRDVSKSGEFYLDGADVKHAKVVSQNGKSCRLEITASRTCDLLLRCRTEDGGYFEHKIFVRSL